MKTSAFPLSPSENQASFFTSSRLGFGVSLILHIGLLVWLFDVFHSMDLQQSGDNVTTISLATFQTPSQEVQEVIEQPKSQPTPHKKRHHRKEIVKEEGRLAKQEEVSPPSTPAPKAKPDEKVEEGEIIQTLSYKNGDEDETLSKIKRAIDRRNKYPPMARKRGLEGEVVVEFVVYKDGRVDNIRIIKPCVHDAFNVAALNAVKKAQSDFPTLSVNTRIQFPVVYELRN